MKLQSKFGNCITTQTLNVSGTELRTDRQTDGQTDGRTDDPITRCPWRTFQAGGIKSYGQYYSFSKVGHRSVKVTSSKFMEPSKRPYYK